jgi:hypothetical protein
MEITVFWEAMDGSLVMSQRSLLPPSSGRTASHVWGKWYGGRVREVWDQDPEGTNRSEGNSVKNIGPLRGSQWERDWFLSEPRRKLGEIGKGIVAPFLQG